MSAIELSVNPFIPKPHTPFQWCAHKESPWMSTFVDLYNQKFNDGSYVVWDEKQQKDVVKGWRNVKGSPKGRRLEAMLDNGDRRFCEPLIKTVLNYRIFSEQDWGESNSKAWVGVHTFMKKDFGYDIHDCLREKGKDEPLPWDHIDVGVSKDWLWNEFQLAGKAEETPGCNQDCSKCGITKSMPHIARVSVCGKRDEWFDANNLTGVVQKAVEDETAVENSG